MVHPEELFDAKARGLIATAERARLDAHVERCVACRFEVLVRADFAAEAEIELRDRCS